MHFILPLYIQILQYLTWGPYQLYLFIELLFPRNGYDSDGKTSYEVNEEKIASFPVSDCPSYPHLEK